MQFDLFSPTEPELILSEQEDRPVLPKGWAWERLSDLAPVSSEKYQPCNGYEFYVGLEHVEKDTGRILPEAQVEPISTIKNRFYAGDILYGKLRPYLNKVAIAPCDGVCSTDMLVLRPTSRIETRYLHWFMLSRGFVNETSANTTGVNLPRVATKFIENYPVPTPPLPEQTRLVARLESLLGEVDAATARLCEAQEGLKTYRQAVIDSAFSELENIAGTVRLGDFADLRGGVTKGRNLQGKETLVVPYLRVANVQDGFLDLQEVKTIEVLPEDLEKYQLLEGDILFTEGGDKDKLGRGTIWTNEIADCIHQNHVFRARVIPERALSKFVTLATKTSKVKRYFFRVAKQTTNLASINMTQLANTSFCLPEIDIQEKIVTAIESRLAATREMETAVAEGLRQAEILRQGILKRAFSGQL